MRMKKVFCRFLCLALICTCSNVSIALADIALYGKPDFLLTDIERRAVTRYDDFYSEEELNALGLKQEDNMVIARFELPVIDGEIYQYVILPNGTISIVGINRATSNLTFPSSLDGKIVTEIGYGIGTRGERAERVSGIGKSLGDFNSDYPVNSLVFPSTMNSLGGIVNIPTQKKITIPDSLRVLYAGYISLGKNASVTYPEMMDYIQMAGFDAGTIIMPETIKYLGNFACESMGWMKTVTLPAEIEHLGVGVFQNNEFLIKVTFREGLQTISRRMFLNCPKLKSVTIPQSMINIEDEAFSMCSKMSTVVFSDQSVKTIGVRAFAECTSIKKLDLPQGLESIGAQAFIGCKKLASVTIPPSVINIGDEAFEGCANKISVTVADGSYAQQWANEHGYTVRVANSN